MHNCLKELFMTDTITPAKIISERYQRIQNVCDTLLEKMESYFDSNLVLEDPKELLRLEALLKIRSRLIDFDREIRTETDALRLKQSQEYNNNREFLIKEVIKKIKKATK